MGMPMYEGTPAFKGSLSRGSFLGVAEPLGQAVARDAAEERNAEETAVELEAARPAHVGRNRRLRIRKRHAGEVNQMN